MRPAIWWVAPSTYSLNAFGTSYGASTLTTTEVDGRLTGNSLNLLKPVSGAVVRYRFEHGANGPHVAGAGGADF